VKRDRYPGSGRHQRGNARSLRGADHCLDVVLAKDPLDREGIWGIHPQDSGHPFFDCEEAVAQVVTRRRAHNFGAYETDFAGCTDLDHGKATPGQPWVYTQNTHEASSNKIDATNA